MFDIENNHLAHVMEKRIMDQGPRPFSEFMALWLSGTSELPGYYANQVRIGYDRNNREVFDFLTSPEISPFFGVAIAKQISEMKATMPHPCPFRIYEMGAGNGTLARDILIGLASFNPLAASYPRLLFGDLSAYDDYQIFLAECQKLKPDFDPLFDKVPLSPAFFEGIDYHIIESSSLLLGRQKEMLAGLPVTFHLASATEGIKPYFQSPGVVITNELVDAFPVELVRSREGVFEQLYIGQGNDSQFEEMWLKPSLEIEDFLETYRPRFRLDRILPVNINSVKWIRDLATYLPSGYIITIDYGGDTSSIAAEKPIRRYSACVKGTNLLKRGLYSKSVFGLTDLTADVDFEVLIKAGELSGLSTVAYLTQKEFLRNLSVRDDPVMWVLLNNNSHLNNMSAAGYDPAQDINDRDSLTTIMGNYRVLIQSKGIPSSAQLTGVSNAIR